MRTCAILLSIALVPALLLGQVTVNSGWAMTPAPAVPGVQPGVPLITTPIVQFGTFSPSPVGATNATANNVAGASNATISNVPPVAPAVQSMVQYSSPYPNVVGIGGQYLPASPTELANTRSGISTQLPNFDWGAARFASVYDIAVPQPSVSLGEVAREWRQKKAELNAREYTNHDINRIGQQYGLPMGGTTAAAVNAGAATSGATQPTGLAAAQPSANMGTTPPSTARPAAPQQQTPEQYQPPTQPPGQPSGAAESTQQPIQPAQNQAGQAEQPAAEGNLPHAASQLPTLLFLGAGAVALGLLLRRRLQRRPGAGF